MIYRIDYIATWGWYCVCAEDLKLYLNKDGVTREYIWSKFNENESLEFKNQFFKTRREVIMCLKRHKRVVKIAENLFTEK